MNRFIFILIACSFGCSNNQKNELSNDFSEKSDDTATYIEQQKESILDVDTFSIINYKTKVDSVLYDITGSKSGIKTDTLHNGDLILLS